MGWTTSQKSTSISTFNHWLGEAQCKDIRATNGLVPWPPLANERLDPKKTKELSLSMAEDSSSKKITSFLSRWLFSCFPCFGFCCSGFPLIGLEWRSFNTQAPPTFLEKKLGSSVPKFPRYPTHIEGGRKNPPKPWCLKHAMPSWERKKTCLWRWGGGPAEVTDGKEGIIILHIYIYCNYIYHIYRYVLIYVIYFVAL